MAFLRRLLHFSVLRAAARDSVLKSFNSNKLATVTVSRFRKYLADCRFPRIPGKNFLLDSGNPAIGQAGNRYREQLPVYQIPDKKALCFKISVYIFSPKEFF